MSFRHSMLTFPVLLLAAGMPAAQPPSPPAQPPAPNNALSARLDQLLTHWERETANTKFMKADITCKRHNKVFNRTETLVGVAKFMRLADGTYGALVELKSPENPNRYEKYICSGGYVYVLRPEERAMYAYALPPRQSGQLPDDGTLPLLFVTKAEKLKERYDLKISKEPTDWWTYIDVFPKYARDQADFTYARLAVLNQASQKIAVPANMPKQIYWVEPNNVEVTWDITSLQRDVPGTVDRREFMKPDLPPGWELKTASTTSAAPTSSRPPQVIRPQQPE